MNGKMKSGKKATVNEVIVSLIIFIIAGLGFIIIHINGIDVIDKSEAVEITASIEAYDYSCARGGYIHYIVLEFSDAENMTIDSSCASWELIDKIAAIEKGTPLHMLIDESENLIMELRTDDNVLINFDDSYYNIRYDKSGFAVLGIITISGGMSLLIHIARRKQKGLRAHNMINPV